MAAISGNPRDSNIYKIISNKLIIPLVLVTFLIPIFYNLIIVPTNFSDGTLNKLDDYPVDSVAEYTLDEQFKSLSTIVGNQTWSGTKTITENVVINGRLNVLAGTTVKIDGNYTIFVNGEVYINGTKSSNVVIQPTQAEPTPGFWGGIRINATGSGNIEFAIIEYTINGIYLNQTEKFNIESNRINHSSESGVVINSTNNITITNNSFSYNHIGLQGIAAENASISFNTVNINENGINLTGSKNNAITKNSISNRIDNVYDDNSNTWSKNYYGDYLGKDTNVDYIGDTAKPYSIKGGGNGDNNPRTKIANYKLSTNVTLATYASLSEAVKDSITDMEIRVPAGTTYAGSQTLTPEGYYYENIKIDSGIGNHVTITGQGEKGYMNTTINGNFGTCFEVDNIYKLKLNGLKITGSNKGIYLHNGAANCTFQNLMVQNNINGTVIENSKDILIDNSTIRDNNGVGTVGGVYIANSQNINIINNNFINNLDGIYLINSDYNTIRDNSFTSNLNSGLRASQSRNNTITKNMMNSNVNSGLNFSNGCNYNNVINSTFMNNDGMQLFNSKNNYFNKAIFEGIPVRWILLDQQSNNNVFIEAGEDAGATAHGILSNNSKNNLFINSTIMFLTIWLDGNSSLIFLNTDFNENYIIFSDNESTFTNKNYLTVKTINQSGAPIQSALVEVYDNKSALVQNGYTNINGELPWIPCTSYIQNISSKDYSNNNHLLVVNDTITEQTDYINVSEKIIKVFTFNYIPVITTVDNETAIENVFYSVKYEAESLDMDTNLTWSLDTNTSFWLQLDNKNQTINGTPHNRDVGNPWINVSVRDSDGDLGFHNFTLTIENTPSEIITENQILVFEDDDYYVDYNSTDDDGYFNETGVLIFPKENFTKWSLVTTETALDWLQFDNETGILNGTPRNNHVGIYTVQVLVNDGHGGKDITSFDLTVNNSPPEIITDDITEAYKNIEYYNDYNSSDDGVTWKIQKDADWLYFDKSTGILNGTPRQADVGDWWVEITAIDEYDGRTIRNFTITVIDLNTPPVIITQNVETAYTKKKYSVEYRATDIDTPQENLYWKLSNESNVSAWLNLDRWTGVLSGEPLRRHVGWYWVVVVVEDGEGGENFTKFKLNVLITPNEPPVLTKIPSDPKVTKSKGKLEIELAATDDYSEGNLVWDLLSNAQWLSINRTSGKIETLLSLDYVGTYWVNVTVTDEDGLFNYTNFTLIVESENAPPQLSNAGMTPKSGNTNTKFIFYVTYTDINNDSGNVFVVIDGKRYSMTADPKYHSEYYKGVNYTTKPITLSEGMHSYYFEAYDEYTWKAILDEGVPGPDDQAETTAIKKIKAKPINFLFYFLIALVIIVIAIIVVISVLKKLSKRHPKLEFINRITFPQVQKKPELEEKGDSGYICPNCKALVDEDTSICDTCGELFIVMEYTCPNCQATVKDVDVFCPKCGVKFEEVELEEVTEEEPIEEESRDVESEEVIEEEVTEEEPIKGEPSDAESEVEPEVEAQEEPVETLVESPESKASGEKPKPGIKSEKLATHVQKVLPTVDKTHHKETKVEHEKKIAKKAGAVKEGKSEKDETVTKTKHGKEKGAKLPIAKMVSKLPEETEKSEEEDN